MNKKILCTLALFSFTFVGCTQQNTTLSTNTTPTQKNENVNNQIERREGALVVGFPTASISLIDKSLVQSSLKKDNGPTVIYEATYFSATEVTALYGKYSSQLAGEGWTEQTPNTQEVGLIKIISGVFTKGTSTLSVAVQTATGEEKAGGVSKVLLKIEQAQ